jgi:hypothetical protein
MCIPLSGRRIKVCSHFVEINFFVTFFADVPAAICCLGRSDDREGTVQARLSQVLPAVPGSYLAAGTGRHPSFI